MQSIIEVKSAMKRQKDKLVQNSEQYRIKNITEKATPKIIIVLKINQRTHASEKKKTLTE